MKIPRHSFVFKDWSISRRLSLWYSLSILILLFVFAVITYAQFHRSIHADFDQHLKHETSLLEPLISIDNDTPVFEVPEALNSTAYQTTGIYATYVRLLSAKGDVLLSSPNFDNISTLDVEIPSDSKEATRSIEWDDSPLRTLYNPLTDQDGSLVGWLEISGIEWVVHQQLTWLIRTYLAGIVISTLLAFGGGYVLAKRALRPVEEITNAAKNIRSTNLSARLPTRFGVNDELTRLAETINDLLSRLEDSIDREQRFISNATHELITPLTTLRGELDLARGMQNDQETLDALNVALNDIDRMEHIIRSLLTLSRAEKLTVAPRTSVDIGELCHEHIDRFRDRAEIRGINLALTCESDLLIAADPVHVGTVLDNLLDNALKYTTDGGSVTVRADTIGNVVRVCVENTGHGFTAETAERMFDRFFRADESEIQKESGSGLGLSIARAIAQAYGGDITGSSRGLGQGASFSVVFPGGMTL
ncbi:MAG: HAMP domain-containing histidine kinase [Bacteroidetes bacterium]|nr:HAMP domain-containing histidine kinase [Bacteroidota bacterium]